MNEDQQVAAPIQEGAAGAPEGAVTEPNANDVAEMYKELGVKASVPTGKAKGRPKSSKVRAEDVSDDDDGDSESGRKNEVKSKGKSKDAPADADDGDAGDAANSKAQKNSSKDGKVQDESEEAGDGVRDAKSSAKKDTEQRSEDDADSGAKTTGRAADDEADSEEESSDAEEGKRPGKSNPKIEQRFQKLSSEVREREQRIEQLEAQLRETTQRQEQAKIAQEDPEYTIDDFRKVRDEEGNIIDLDPERAELAWRRWKDGYEQRASERQAAQQHEAALEREQAEMSEQIMRQSVEAYDTLTNLMDDYPELVSTSGQYDPTFAAKAMPIINEALIYQPGTEPGNEEGNQPVVMGLKLNPKMILDAMKDIQAQKRSLPLNGINDNVESRSNVNVPHGRSSDSTVNAANELYKELGINKRI